jgi:hypothetical protein
MPPNLACLPFDLLFNVALHLDVEDFVHMTRTCAQLRYLLTEETLCRQILKVHLRAIQKIPTNLDRNSPVRR